MMFSHLPPQDTSHWQRRLDSLFPPGGDLSHLRIQWEPGERWDPVGRFILYQMLPPARVPLFVLPMLEGPDPRKFTRYDRILRQVVREPGAPLISRRQWLLYRETGSYGMPYWVVQGNRGGHKIQFTRVESMLARMQGHPTGEPPKICDLPYAPVNERTIEKLIDLDQMRTYNLLVDFTMRSPEMLDADEERGAEEAKRRLWEWVESQVADWITDLPHGAVERVAGLDRPIRVFT